MMLRGTSIKLVTLPEEKIGTETMRLVGSVLAGLALGVAALLIASAVGKDEP